MFANEYVSLKRLKRMVDTLCRNAEREDMPIGLDFIMKSLYPDSYFNYLADLQARYNDGYEDGIIGRKKKKPKPKKKNKR